MKKLIFKCALAICGLSATLSAAQNECHCSQYDVNYCDDGFTGLYFGGNVAVLSHTAYRNDADGFLTDNSGWTSINTGSAGGVLGGYDLQYGNAVLGLGFDWNISNTGGKLREDPNGGDQSHYIKSSLRWGSSIYGRAGLAVGDTLIYIKAGPAATRFKTTWSDTSSLSQQEDTSWGWTGGLGTEFRMHKHWSLGAELVFTQFAEKAKSFLDVNGGSRFSFAHSDSSWSGKIMFSYRL